MNAKLQKLKTMPKKKRKNPQQTPAQVKKLQQILPKGAPTSGENAL